MDEIVNFVAGTLIFIALLCFAEVMIVYLTYKEWIKEGKIVETFPTWNGTKKPLYWFLGWYIAKCVTDAIIVIAVVIIVPIDRAGLLILMLPIWFVAYFFQMIIYVICETIVINKIRRKNTKPDTDIITTNNAVKNEDNNLTNVEDETSNNETN